MLLDLETCGIQGMDTLFIGQKIAFFDRLDSTNNYAAKVLNDPLWPEGSVIVADEQTSGRGRGDKMWESEPGANLTFSLILRPHFLTSEKAFLLSMMSSLAILNVLKGHGLKAQIKWPNDLLISDMKVCGMLNETHIRGQHIRSAILGIGLNVSQHQFIAPRACSMEAMGKCAYDRMEVLQQCCSHLEAQYLRLKRDPASIIHAYNQHLFARDEERRFTLCGHSVRARLTEVRSDGHALFRSEGTEKRYQIDEVVWDWN